MTYKELQLNKIYSYGKISYFLIIEKNKKDFYYYSYNYKDEKWYKEHSVVDDFKNSQYVWSKLKLTKIDQKIKYKMIRDLFKYRTNNEI